MAQCRVIKGGWWWLHVERCPGDVLEASAVQVERWAAEGMVEPLDPEPKPTAAPVIETATVRTPETAVVKRKRK